MVLWFAVLGRRRRCAEVVRAPGHPARAVAELRGRVRRRAPVIAFIAMGAVVLVITGAEALYADMGHFGRPPIRRAWFLARLPRADPELPRPGRADPARPGDRGRTRSYLLLPGWAQLPLVVLATVATVIASQAVISGAFSVSRQAVRLGFLPHLRGPAHLRRRRSGQIYVPAVNWALFVGVLVLIARVPAPRRGSPPPTASRSPARS